MMDEKAFCEIVARYCTYTNCEVHMEDSFSEDLLLSSLKMMMLTVELEERAGCSLSIDDIGKVRKVKDLWDCIHQQEAPK